MKSMAAAIEFGTSKIVTLVGEGNGSGPAQLLGFGVVPYDGYSDGHWNASDEEVEQAIMKSVREAELSSGREIKEIYVGVPGDFIHLEQNEVVLDLESERRITPEDVDDVMNLALDYKNQREGVIIHRSPAWFTVDDRRTMEPAGLKGQVIRCMASFVVADPTFLEDMQARMEQQDIHISGYLSPALGEALLLVPPEERDKVAVLVDVGYLTTEVLFIQGDALIRYKVLPMGGGHLAADLAMELGITMDMAEELKRKYTFGIGQDQLSVKDPEGQTVSFHRGKRAGRHRAARCGTVGHGARRHRGGRLPPLAAVDLLHHRRRPHPHARRAGDHLLRRGAHVPRAHAAGRQAQFTRVFLGDRPARARLRVREPDGDQAPGKRRQDRRILQGVLHKVTPGQAFFSHLI